MPHSDVCLQLWSPKIQHPVLQSKFFGGEFFPFPSGDWNRRCRSRPHDVKVADPHFNFARNHAGVPGSFVPEHHDPFDEYHRLGSKGGASSEDCCWGPRWVARELHQPIPVAEVEENDPTEISAAMNPATESDSHAQLGASQ